MSVRRLADESIQPGSFAFSSANQQWAEKKITEYPVGRQQSAVIPLLWRAQEQDGWITRACIESIAEMLGMAYIRVLEVATFYTMFQLKPVGTKAHIQVCGTTPCMLRGAEDLIEVCKHKIHHDPFTTNADGTLSWEEVECMGACVNAPMIGVFSDTYEDLTPSILEKMIDDFEAGRPVKPGPQIARQFSAAEGGATTLLEPPTAKRTYKAFPPPPPPAPAPGAPAAAAPAAPAAPQAPTTPGKKNDVPEEAAPALKGPGNAEGASKVSTAKAEAERGEVNAAAKADGTPNAAMREDATGAESPAGKRDGGAATGKGKPRQLFEAAAGTPDDLKLISGVGPVLEGNLNAIGITTWAQVAKLTPEQIGLVEGELGFKGRVLRDNWLQQADVLARGGVDEYRKVFGKAPR